MPITAALSRAARPHRTGTAPAPHRRPERYTRAVDQLGATGTDGHEKVDLQLGGIYALERLARDSPPDQPTIVEVLTAFVRQRAIHNDAPNQEPGAQQDLEEADPDTRSLQNRLPTVQAAMRVLGRMPRPTHVRLELHDVDLRRADLQGATLTGAYLADADLTRANLGGTTLTRANLERTKLTGAYLAGADLTDANLYRATLTGAYLADADLTDAYLGGADLTDAHLTRADLTRAHLRHATLTGANLNGADLTGAHLTDADLTGAHLRLADLTGADLAGATLTGATLGGADLTDVRHDADTRWPDGFAPPSE